MLRNALLLAGVALLAIGGWLVGQGVKAPGIQALALGGLLTLAMLFEPWRYRRRIVDAAPPGFTRTEERFEDPGSGRNVTVYVKAPVLSSV